MLVFDYTYMLLMAPALLLAIYAQAKVKSAVSRYGRVRTGTGLTGAGAARRILDAYGLGHVRVEQSGGFLSDHYDPRSRTLRLSPDIYQTPSVAAVGIAAHEAGHALQHASGYALLKLRNAIVPTARFGSWLAFPMIFIGFLFSLKGLATAGFLLFCALVLFQVVTLPLELDASNRAKRLIAEMGIIQGADEKEGVSKVLNAAAMTYLAATITALVQLLYFAMRLGLLGGDD